MIRVCCMDDCPRPLKIYGCSYPGEQMYCDDCRDDTPQTYKSCVIRKISPPAEDSTHGFCRECARKYQARYRKTLNEINDNPGLRLATM